MIQQESQMLFEKNPRQTSSDNMKFMNLKY